MARDEIINICQTLAFIRQVFGCPLSWHMMKSEICQTGIHQTGFWLPTVLACDETRNICQTLAFIKQIFGCPMSWYMMRQNFMQQRIPNYSYSTTALLGYYNHMRLFIILVQYSPDSLIHLGWEVVEMLVLSKDLTYSRYG